MTVAAAAAAAAHAPCACVIQQLCALWSMAYSEHIVNEAGHLLSQSCGDGPQVQCADIYCVCYDAGCNGCGIQR